MQPHKLELRHMAPYLPYRLPMVDLRNLQSKGHICSLNSVLESYGFRLAQIFCRDLLSASDREWMPLLHPLSLFDSEVRSLDTMSDGHIFNPSKELQKIFPQIDIPPFQVYDGEDISTGYYSYPMINKLFEWHFDVFGLIPKGLAVSSLVYKKPDAA